MSFFKTEVSRNAQKSCPQQKTFPLKVFYVKPHVLK